MIQEGKKAPDFTLEDQDGVSHTLSQYLGKEVLIYFYPKDDTPGCTKEACEFRDAYKIFQELGTVILGISPDSVKSHKKFTEKYTLPFPLLADIDHKVTERYGIWQMKKFMGREYMGVVRSSFLIDKEGKIAKVYEQVKAEGHAGNVAKDLGSKKLG